MINQQYVMDIEKQIKLIKDIQYLDFGNLESIWFMKFLQNLMKNPKNQQYKESIDFLRNFEFFRPDSFNQKYRKLGIKQEVINAFYDILDKLPKGTFKAKIASIILVEDKLNKDKRLDLAKIIVENFAYDFDKIFERDYIISNIYFTIDLGHKFDLLKKFNVVKILKNTFKIYLNKDIDNVDYKFIVLYKFFVEKYQIWNDDEHIEIIEQLYKSSMDRKEKLFKQKTLNQTEKEIICSILEFIVFVMNFIKKEKYEPSKIYQQIIDIHLEFAEKASDDAISFSCLMCARDIADKKQDKRLSKEINKKMQMANKKMLQKQQNIHIPLNDEQKQTIKQYNNILKELLLKDELNLFEIFIQADFCTINFDHLRDNGSLARYIMTTLEFDSDDLVSAIHSEKDDIFVDYYHCVKWYAIFYRILKIGLFKKFYPQKECFYPLVYNNNIIPQGYEEIIARMLYVGIHNDSMDFFIYLSASIEAILRNLLIKSDISPLKTNKKDKTQEYDTLETMIADIKKNCLLDESDIKEIELIFCKKGFNIRNKIAHSRFNTNSFLAYTWLCDYLWCFMMRFFIKYRLYIPKFDISPQNQT